MISYCRAYPVDQVARFAAAAAVLAELDAADFVYLSADLTLRRDAVGQDGAVLVSADTPGWAAFCREELTFVVPDFAEDAGAAD
ncbi:hypothetical protein ACFPM7_23680 [Actinokineospora guangxiensis]|uniref:Uncharacterized protein n=1 Tax=Actinokineospora guangxiensis TaxID=1490288 RepID=A0ABW0ETI5_9PSEU